RGEPHPGRTSRSTSLPSQGTPERKVEVGILCSPQRGHTPSISAIKPGLRSPMPSRPAPLVHRLRLLRSAVVCSSSALLPCSRPRLCLLHPRLHRQGCKWKRCRPEHLQGEGSPHCQCCIPVWLDQFQLHGTRSVV
uniref:Uncharacterized protein n=1 Tax=Triticum urartu TaxID=4572 RepID=A0A8R7QSV9_TRIUA